MKRLALIRWLTLFTVGASLLGPLPAARAQTPIPASKIQAVLDAMTPEERVGQLFLVTFRGTDVSAESHPPPPPPPPPPPAAALPPAPHHPPRPHPTHH